ncbi:hypothetical protein [Actibacterium sp. D379-3]
MRVWLVVGLWLMAGCDSPAVTMHGVPARQVSVDNSRFSVYVQGNRAEAIRTNVEYGRGARGIMARSYRAIELASGCQIVPGTFDGDPARMTANIACAGVS